MGSYGRREFDKDPLDVLKQKIKEGTLNGAYLFWGAEEYTKDFYAEKLRKNAKSSPLPEFNYIVFDAEHQNAGELEECVQALPYMWESKCVEVRGLNVQKLSADEGERYARIIEDLPDYATLLFLLRAGEYSGGTGAKKPEKEGASEKRNGFKLLLSALEQYGTVVEFQPEKGDKLAAWVTKHFSARGVKIAPGLPGMMISYCGNDMYTLQGEISKLCELYDGKPLTEQDVKTYCCANESYVFFDVASCMNRKDLAGARKILSGLRLNAESVPMAMGYLASNYQLMLLVKAGVDHGKTAAQIASEQKIPSWKVTKALSSLHYVTMEELNAAVAMIAETDLRLKTVRSDPASALELLVCRICGYGKR